MNKDNMISFGIGITTGAIIGGVIALLFAPKSGEQTRKMIKDEATEVVETVKEKSVGVVDALKEKTGKAVDSVKEETSEVVDAVEDAASNASRKGQAVIEALKS